MSEKINSSNLSYCAELVRKYDPDRFLLSMFAPAKHQQALWTIFAFNHEIAKTREVVSESTLGHIRLQWWRDALKGIYENGDVLEHEVVKPLARVISDYDLSREHFDKLIYAREFDLENVAPANIEGLFHYADYTTTPLLQLCAEILGAKLTDVELKPLALRYTVIGVLRSTPILAQSGRMMVPQDLCDHHQLSLDDFFSEEGQSQLKKLSEEVLHALPEKPHYKSEFFKAMSIFTDIYARYLKALDYDVFSSRASLKPPFLALRLTVRTKILS